jgi:hypothetical protein
MEGCFCGWQHLPVIVYWSLVAVLLSVVDVGMAGGGKCSGGLGGGRSLAIFG